jgi:hypothetical protein
MSAVVQEMILTDIQPRKPAFQKTMMQPKIRNSLRWYATFKLDKTVIKWTFLLDEGNTLNVVFVLTFHAYIVLIL